MSKKTVFVTGASGFIAKHIVLKLLNAGYSVRGSVRSLDRSEEIVNAVSPFVNSDVNLNEDLSFVELGLSSDNGWDEALAGCDVLMHTASPFPMTQPDDQSEIIKPAVDGTLRALKYAKSNNVNRVIITSSVVAISCGDKPEGRLHDERDWSDINHPLSVAYNKSKTLAEKAAWEFVADEAPEISLTTINPGLVLGAPLDTKLNTSIELIQRIMKGNDPALPKLGFSCVDVEDVAEMHVHSLSANGSIGQRIIASAGAMWFVDVAKVLKENFPDQKVTVRQAPNFLIKFMSFFDKSIKTIVPTLGRLDEVSNEKAKSIFDMEFIDPEKSIIATGEFLIENELV